MSKIKILTSGCRTVYLFDGGDDIDYYTSKCCEICHYKDCKYGLSFKYVYIMKKLKETGLLPEDYPLLCCNHYKMGMKEYEKQVNRRIHK